MTSDRSRVLDLASRLAGRDAEAALRTKEVTIRFEATYPGAAGTAKILARNLRQLPITLRLDAGHGPNVLAETAVAELVSAADEIDPDRSLQVCHATTASDVTIHIGPDRKAEITVVPDGHGARLHRSTPLPAVGGGSALGSMMAAAFATAEALKDLLGLPEHSHPRLRRLAFDPVTLAEPGKVVPYADVPGGTALVGCGAIGTAIAVIVGGLGLGGELTVVDPETFDDPNLFTYSLGSQDDADDKTHKTDLVAGALPNLDIVKVRGAVHDWIVELGQDPAAPWPETIVSGVDSVAARHQIARLQAATVYDASTGGGAGTTLSLAEARFDGPCIRCYYPVLPPQTLSPEARLVEATGLPVHRIAQGDTLTDADLAGLDPRQRELLARYVNQPICGLARLLGFADTTFRPSAVFVAQQAAALAVGALLRHSTWSAGRAKFVQYDALLGPRDGHTVGRRASPACTCQRDAALIRQVRHDRSLRR